MPRLWPSSSWKEAHAEPKLVRKLGNNEAYQLAMYILDQYRGTSVSCRYVVPGNLTGRDQRETLIDKVQVAISDNVLKHPVLQVGIMNAEPNQPTFVRLDSLDLRQHIEWRSLDTSADFESVFQELTILQLDATYSNLERQPGWRIVVLHQQETGFLEILFTWNHPHADGMSGNIFHLDLLRSLNAGGTNEKYCDSDAYILKLPSTPTRFPPPIEQVMELPLDMKYLVKAMLTEGKPRVLHRSPTLAHWAPITASSYKTQFRSFTIENGILSKVLDACRHHPTTLTGLFHGLMLASLASHLGKEVASGFQSPTTINMRRFIPHGPPNYSWLDPEGTMGNFVTQIHHIFDAELANQICTRVTPPLPVNEAVLFKELSALIWDAAARVRSEIADKLEIGVKNDVVGT
ncbi:hypothetical protein DL768_002414 [Monosporascus sp. mg162]|nr:hypothetical protein DL768_002414 [Monosporascus sp. mg162]